MFMILSSPTVFSPAYPAMANFNQYGDNQGGWGEQYPEDIPHTTYSIDQPPLAMSFTPGIGPYGYQPTGSASHDNTGSSGSYMHPSTLATQPWDMEEYHGAWTGSAMPPSTYEMASGNLPSNAIMDRSHLDGVPTDFPDISNLGDNLPAPDQQPLDYSGNEYDYQQPPTAGPGSSPAQLSCDVCEETFANQKNWDRHLLSEKHIRNVQDYSDVSKYKCACNYVQARKDNYRRHLKGCTFRIDFAYVCSCGDWTQNKASHEQHIDMCGRKRRGKGQK